MCGWSWGLGQIAPKWDPSISEDNQILLQAYLWDDIGEEINNTLNQRLLTVMEQKNMYYFSLGCMHLKKKILI